LKRMVRSNGRDPLDDVSRLVSILVLEIGVGHGLALLRTYIKGESKGYVLEKDLKTE